MQPMPQEKFHNSKVSNDTLIIESWTRGDYVQLLFLILGMLLVAVAYNYGKRVGALLLIVIVLGAWLTAKKKGLM